MSTSRPLLSVIVPLLNEADNLPRLYERLSHVAGLLDRNVEFILIDDGSTDGSYDAMRALHEKDGRFRTIKLSRNFGSHGACMAGFIHARGDHAVILTADLQDPPELLPEMIKTAESGHDIVWGQRAMRDDPAVTVTFSHLYNRLMRRWAMPNWPEHGFDFVLISRRVLQAVIANQERNSSIFGQILWTGYPQASIPYHRAARQSGRSKWTLSKKIKLAIDSFVSFSYVPIRLISLIGLLCALFGGGYAMFVLAMKTLRNVSIGGWASLMTVILFLGGVQLIMLGVIGEYLWRVLDEARKRPSYIVAETKGFEKPL